MARAILKALFAGAGALFLGGCVPIERPAPVGAAASADFTGDLSRENEGGQDGEAPASPYLNSFQLKGASDLADIEPHQVIACLRGQDNAVFTLYFYEEDESGAVCSFLFYSRIHQEDGALETSRRISAEEDANCVSPAQEKLMVKRQIGWNCKEQEGAGQSAGAGEANPKVSLPGEDLTEPGLKESGKGRAQKS